MFRDIRTKIIEIISSSRRRQFSQFVNNLERMKNRRSDFCDSCCVLDSWRNINAWSQLRKNKRKKCGTELLRVSKSAIMKLRAAS